jgi:GNAT superfamily N-acetyltransferase
MPARNLEVRSATQDRWDDVTELLGRRGSVNGCWCMFFRLEPSQRRSEWGEGNRKALRRLIDSGRPPGLVAYSDGASAGWVSLAPRQEYGRLDRSAVSKPVDDKPVWSLVCFYVAREYRGAGVARVLLQAAIRYAREQHALILEAYPVDDTLGEVPPEAAYHGLSTLLQSEGFVEVARRTPKRPVMRLNLENPS